MDQNKIESYQSTHSLPSGFAAAFPREDASHTTPSPSPQEEARQQKNRRQLWLSVVLFVLTFFSALWSQLPRFPGESVGQVIEGALRDPERLMPGLLFATALMSILLAHEMGHFMTARYYQVDQSPPFFIPAPGFFFFGTLGAVILMRSQPRNRRVLLNVAVMGPYAGLLVAIPAAIWGLQHSTPVDPADIPAGSLWFGSSLLFHYLENTFSPNGAYVILHPVALAGWVGLFVTSLNLIPAAQLDGGHVAYALLGKHQEKLSLAVVLLLFGAGMYTLLATKSGGGGVWILWALLLFMLGIRHPPVQQEHVALSRWQKINAVMALLIFVVTFIPVPAKIIGTEELLNQGVGQEESEEPEEAPPFLPRKTAPRQLDETPGAPATNGEGGPAEEFRL